MDSPTDVRQRPLLPTEIWRMVYEQLPRSSLKTTAFVSREHYALSSEILFQHLRLSMDSLEAFDNGNLKHLGGRVRYVSLTGLADQKRTIPEIFDLARIYCGSLGSFPNIKEIDIQFAATDAGRYELVVAVFHHLSQYTFYQTLSNLKVQTISIEDNDPQFMRWMECLAKFSPETEEFLRPDGPDTGTCLARYGRKDVPSPPALEQFTIIGGDMEYIDMTGMTIPWPVLYFQRSARAGTLKVLKLDAGCLMSWRSMLDEGLMEDSDVVLRYDSVVELAVMVPDLEGDFSETLEAAPEWFPNLEVLNIVGETHYVSGGSQDVMHAVHTGLSQLPKLKRASIPWPHTECDEPDGSGDVRAVGADKLEKDWYWYSGPLESLEYIEFVDGYDGSEAPRTICRLLGKAGYRDTSAERCTIRSEVVDPIFTSGYALIY
ncbi:hypothetical protein H072_7148 [Dactylellina haptotyla CBS 200.50]|uniref:Cadherin domain-containing protein n=1 Tax=Dactylellina haptotyla (strain CBS 200.50) TaxID=1284197 RepID=S8BID7_DACHA|nr:hypothetical protein H072_7148 [Dactylellina haptotyla CBS 200.50]